MHKKLNKKKLYFKTVLLFLLPSICFAANGNSIVSVLDSAANFLTSTVARSAGVIAIASVGYLYLFQNKIDKLRALSIIASIGIILGAGTLYDTLVG